MSKRLPLILVIVAILFVILTMTFAQDVPFHVEVLAQSARMRWGPGPTFVVQHYANAGHVLLVLDVDADSDPPWTWYYARTPSGAQSWIRADLVRRRADGNVPVEQRVSNPTGNYPVRDDNFCNTNLFRPCQEGADHQLWEAGYWASNRYNHWESGGWDLNTVYYLNPCREDRVCPRREDWDSGRLEAEILAVTITPDATLTPFGIEVTVVSEIRTVWETLTGVTNTLMLEGNSIDMYNPLAELKTDGGDGSIFGGFRISSEDFAVYCDHWYRTSSDALVKRPRQRVNLNNLPDDVANDGTRDGDDRDRSNVQCFTHPTIDEDDVVARHWELTLTRRYGNFAGISGITWKLTATYGTDEPDDDCTRTSKCTDSLDTTVRGNLGNYAGAQPTAEPPLRPGIRVVRDLFLGTVSGVTCSGSTRTEGENPNVRTFYVYSCEDTEGPLQHELTFTFTHTDNRFVAPTPTS